MNHVKGIDRDQVTMISLGEMVSQDSIARIIDLFVDALPIKELGFKYAETSPSGRPAYAPSDMLKLYMYGYRHSIRSSRKLEAACKVNIEVMWLIKGLRPDDRTIARFRKDNPQAIRKAFRHFVLILKDWDLLDGTTVAIDSFKIRAQNSLKNNLNQKRIDRQSAYHQEKIENYLSALDGDDLQEEEREELQQKHDHHQGRKEHFEQMEQQLKDSGEKQISLTDPDAKAVVFQRNSIQVGYNIQAACDGKNKLFIHSDVHGVNDTHALHPMAKEVKDLLQPPTMTTLTDKGYTTAEQLGRCEKDGIITYSAPKDHSAADNGLFNLDAFTYDQKNDHFICPAGETLSTNGTHYRKGDHHVKHYKTKPKNCRNCPLRDACTRNKSGKIIERSATQSVLERNRLRVEADPQYYRQRQQITEHQFGTLKRQWGFTFTLMKRKANVLAEVELAMLNYNLCRAVSILGSDELKSRLNVLFSVFLSIIYRLLTTLRQPLTQSELKYRLAAQFLRGKTQQQLTLS
jgi:transposase